MAKDPRSSAEIEFIFKEFLDNNKKVSQIANSLADAGKCTPLKYVKGNRKVGDKPYNDHVVRNILRNPIYAGYVYRTGDDGERELYEGRHEAYISKEDWEALQAKLQEVAGVHAAKAANFNLRHRNAYPLKGILFCECGGQMSAFGSGKLRKDGSSYFYYVCNQKKYNSRGTKCQSTISSVILESVVFSFLAYLSKDKISKSSILAQQGKYRVELESELKDLSKQAKALEGEINKLLDRLSKEDLTSSLNDIVIAKMKSKSHELDLIKIRKNNVAKEIAMLDKDVKLDSLQLRADLAHFEELQYELSDDEKAQAVQLVIKKATLKSLRKEGSKRFFRLIIEPTQVYADKIAIKNIEFFVDNSAGKGAWTITAPFALESKNQGLKANFNSKEKRKRHFLSAILRMYEEFLKSNLYLQDFAEKKKLKRGILGRRFQMLTRLSPTAIEFILGLIYEKDTAKITFNKLESISKTQTHLHLKSIKALLK